MDKCYDCGDTCTKDYSYYDIKSEDDNDMRLPLHHACYERATKGGSPIYPEREQ